MSQDDRPTLDDRAGGSRPAASARPDRTTEPTAAGADRPGADPDADAAGRYRRGTEIARGGMGRVVEAEDAILGRTVALKETLELDDDARRRFEREVRITARLEHPSIVPVYDAGRTTTGMPFYVMRRLSGRPLDEVIRSTRSLDERLTYVPNILAVLDAVGHAHRRGIIHRDLKPANVLVGELGETVVIDWGLAKVLGEVDPASTVLPALGDALGDPSRPRAAPGAATVVGTVIGTPGFMPPEQATAGEVDARSDVYALGATLYHLLAGQPPYAGSTASAILDRAVAEAPTPLPSLAPGVPRDLVTIVETAMAADPAVRYRDAVAMGEDLRRFLTGQLVASHHYSRRERVIRYLRRHRNVLAVIGLAVAVLAVVGTLSLRRIIADRDRIAVARAAAEAGRADAERKSQELRRLADGLILDRARSNLAADPTLALALLKRLGPDSPRWPEARGIVADARHRGIAFGLVGHNGTTYELELAPDCRHVLSAGSVDGEFRVHDLVTRTSRTIGGPYSVREARDAWWGDRLVRLVKDAHQLVVMDPATGAVERVLAGDAIGFGVGTFGALVWLAGDGTAYFTPPGSATAERVAQVAGAHFIEVAPRGSRVLVTTGDGAAATVHPFVRDGAGWRAEPPITTTLGVRASLDDQHLAYLDGEELVELDLTATPPTTRRQRVPPLTIAFGYSGSRLWSIHGASGGLHLIDRAADAPRLPLLAFLRGMQSPPVGLTDDLLVVAGAGVGGGGVVIARGQESPIELHVGEDVVSRVAARPGCPLVVGAAAGHLLVWDLAELLPAQIDLSVVTSGEIYAAGARTVLFTDTATWYRLDPAGRGDLSSRPMASDRYSLYFDEGALVEFVAPDEIAVTDVDTWQRRTVRATARVAVPIDADRLVVGEPSGAVAAIRFDTGARVALGDLGAAPTAAARTAGFIAIAGGAHLLRTDGATSQTLIAPEALDAIDVDTTGTLYGVAGNRVYRWPAGATAPSAAAEAPIALTSVEAIAPDDAMFVAADRSVWRLDARTGALGQILPGLDSTPQISRDRRCAVAIKNRGAVIADLVGRTWWTLTTDELNDATPAPDCSAIFATTNRNTIVRFDIAVPYGDDLRAWLEQRTNARAAEGHGMIEWVIPPS